MSTVQLHYKPRQRRKDIFHRQSEIKDVQALFKTWLYLVRAYDAVSLNPEDQFLNQYTDEFITNWELTDKDKDIAPFDDKRQKLLFYTLVSIEEVIIVDADPEIDTAEILAETKSLKSKIPVLTKSQTVEILSRIFAKIKLKGSEFALKIGKKAGEILVSKGFGKLVDYLYSELPIWASHLISK